MSTTDQIFAAFLMLGFLAIGAFVGHNIGYSGVENETGELVIEHFKSQDNQCLYYTDAKGYFLLDCGLEVGDTLVIVKK